MKTIGTSGVRAFVAAAVLAMGGWASADPIKLVSISVPFNNPVGIDYHQPTNSVILSAYYPSGSPYNLERLDQNGNYTQFSTLSGLTDELKIATVRSGNVGGFSTGELFTGNGVDGQIVKVSANGSTIVNPWVDLPGSGNGLMRGSLYVDRTGVWGGDLIAVTTVGQVWRVTSAGVPTLLASVGTHLEGVITVPNDSTKYGPLAGKIIAGAEQQGLLYAIDTTGQTSTHALGVNVEDIDLIEANANFFGVDYGNGRLLGATASYFSGAVGDILLTQEFPNSGTSGLHRLSWNGTSLVTTPYTFATGSESPRQWEHVTFAPAGVREIPPVVPLPAAAWAGMALLGALGVRRATRRERH